MALKFSERQEITRQLKEFFEVSGGGISITNDVANRLLTAGGDGQSVIGQVNLTFNGTQLDLTGNAVVTTNAASNAPILDVFNSSTSSSAKPMIRVGNNALAALELYRVGDSSTTYINANQSGNGVLTLQTDTSSRLTIESSGNIGIYDSTSTTTDFYWDAANSKLGIVGDGGSVLTSPKSAVDVRGSLTLGEAPSNSILNTNEFGKIEFYSYDNSLNSSGVTSKVVNIATSDFSASNNNHRLGFFINDGLTTTGTLQERLSILQNGNVGVGTESPSAALSVQYNPATTNGFELIDSRDINCRVGFLASGGALGIYTSTIGSFSSSNLAIAVDTSQRVGINTGSPTHTLDVNGSVQIERNGASPLLRFTDTSSSSRWIGIPDGSSRFAIYGTNGLTEEFVLSGGNVGIGTTSPSSYSAYARNLVVASSGNGGVTIKSGTTSTGNIFFANAEASTSNNGVIQYNHNTNEFRFDNYGTNQFYSFNIQNSEKMIITSAGHVLIGLTSNVGFGGSDKQLLINGTTNSRLEFGVGGAQLGGLYANADKMVVYTSGQDYLEFDTNSIERMRIDSAGSIFMGGNHLSSTPGNAIVAAPYGSGTDIDGGDFNIYAGRSTGTGAGGDIILYTSPAGVSTGSGINAHIERMRITSDGKVGINVDPARQLSVLGEGNATVATIITPSTSGGNFGILDLKRQDNAVNSSIGVRFSHGNSANVTNDIEYGFIGGGIECPAAGSEKGFLNFAVGPGRAEHMRITGDGNVGIGTDMPGSVLDVRGGNVRIDGGSVTDRQLYFRNQSTGTVGGSIRSDQTLSLFAGVGGSPNQAVTIERETLYTGIGIDNPTHRLHVNESTGELLRLQGCLNYNYDITTKSTGYHFDHEIGSGNATFSWSSSSNGEMMRIDQTGLGVGTNDINTKLHISGDFDGSSNYGGNNPNKGILIEKRSGIGSDYSINDAFGIDFTSSSNAALTYPVAGIYAVTKDVASYNGGELHLLTKCNTDATLQSRMMINRGGNVGIGTNVPDTLLHISGSGNIVGKVVSTNAAAVLQADSVSTESSILYFTTAGSQAWKIQKAPTTGNLEIRNSTDLTKFAMLDNGNVGIGQNSPEVLLDVRKDETVSFAPNSDQRIRAQIVARNNNETAENFSSISLVTGGGNQSEWSINNVYKSAYNGDLAFKTRAGGGVSDWRERMRITNAGYVGIGVVPTSKLTVYSQCGSNTTGNSLATDFAQPAASGAVTCYCRNLWFGSNIVCMPAAVTDSGYRIGTQIEHFINTSAFAGVLKSSKAIWSRVGTYTGATGRICCAVGVHAEVLISGNTTINKPYGFFQTINLVDGATESTANVKNYFQSRIVQGPTCDAPAACLYVAGTSSPTTDGWIARFDGGTTTPYCNRYMLLNNTYTGSSYDALPIVWQTNSNGSNCKSHAAIYVSSDGTMQFRNASSNPAELGTSSSIISCTAERMKISAVGNVSVNDTYTTSFMNTATAGKYIGVASNNNDALFIAHSSGQGVGYFGYDYSADRLIIATDNGGGNNSIQFSVNAGATSDGTADNLASATAAMTIDASSNVSISSGYLQVSGNPSAGVISTNGNGSIGGLTVNGLFMYGKGSAYDVALANAGTNVALAIPTGTTNICITNTLNVGSNITAAGDITSSSDCRLKSNITSIDCAIFIVNSLCGRRYIKDDKPSIGVVAQEVESVLPEVVHGGDKEDDFKSVSYGNITAVLIEAIKEQQKQIDYLKEEINILKSNI